MTRPRALLARVSLEPDQAKGILLLQITDSTGGADHIRLQKSSSHSVATWSSDIAIQHRQLRRGEVSVHVTEEEAGKDPAKCSTGVGSYLVLVQSIQSMSLVCLPKCFRPDHETVQICFLARLEYITLMLQRPSWHWLISGGFNFD